MSNGVVTPAGRASAIVLRRVRERRGWSWADLARALRDAAIAAGTAVPARGSITGIQRTIARWESRTGSTVPGERYQRLLLQVYLRGPDGRLDPGPGSDFAAVIEALAGLGIPEERIAELVELVATDESVGRVWPADPFPRTPGHESAVPEAVLAALRREIDGIDQRIGSASFIRLQMDLAPALHSCRALTERGRSTAAAEVAVRAHALAGRLAFETGDDERSSAHYDDAMTAARSLTDQAVRAAVGTSRAMTLLHSRNEPRAALGTARAALTAAHRGTDRAVRARAHAVYAEVQSRFGTSKDAIVALDHAWRSIGHLTADDERGGFTATRLNGFDGLCALHRGDHSRAETSLAAAMVTLDSTRDSVQRAIVGADLALARLRCGNVVACTELLHHVVDLTAGTGARVPMRRICAARQELRPWRGELFISDLDDHLHEAFLGR